jgi:hypothetical protein
MRPCASAVRRSKRSQILHRDLAGSSAVGQLEQLEEPIDAKAAECIAIPLCHAVAIPNFSATPDCSKLDDRGVGAGPSKECEAFGVEPAKLGYVEASSVATTRAATNLCRCAANYPQSLDLGDAESQRLLFALWLDGKIHLYDRPECIGPAISDNSKLIESQATAAAAASAASAATTTTATTATG